MDSLIWIFYFIFGFNFLLFQGKALKYCQGVMNWTPGKKLFPGEKGVDI